MTGTRRFGPLGVLQPYTRFDLGVKFALAERIRSGCVSNQIRYEYLAHLAAWNGFCEPNSTKVGADAFLQTLTGLVESFTAAGRYTAPPISVASNGLLQNGVHRLAAALACGVEPLIEVTEGPADHYDCFYFHCFTSPHGQSRLPRRLLIHMLFRTISLWREDIRVALVFPGAQARDGGAEAARAIAEHGAVLWDEAVAVPTSFLSYLVLNAYPGEPWTQVGTTGAGIHRKLANIAVNPTGPHPLRMIIFVPHDPVEVNALKQELRQFYSLGNESLHISSDAYDSFSLAAAFCSSIADVSALRFLSYRSPRLAEVLALSTTLRDRITHSERAMLVGSAALELFGGRRGRDLDFIGAGLPTIDPALTSHNAYDYLYEANPDDLVDRLDCKFFFGGLPVAAPGLVMAFKDRRNEPKDQADIADMARIFSGRPQTFRPGSGA